MPHNLVSAQVVTLTAQIHVLMVGSRQVTKSIYNQLDCILDDDIEVMGRTHDEQIRGNYDYPIIGKCNKTGNLVKRFLYPEIGSEFRTFKCMCGSRLYQYYQDLPLIVLAGLR